MVFITKHIKNDWNGHCSDFGPKENIIMKIEKFNFKKNWNLVEPHLNDPDILEKLDYGMSEFAADHCWKHHPQWNRSNGIGPWEYARGDHFHQKALDECQNRPEYKKLMEKYSAIAESIGESLDYLMGGKAFNSEFEVLLEMHYPQKNTYQWYQCFGAAHYLATWQKALAEEVFPNKEWHIFQTGAETKEYGHSTIVGKSQSGDWLIFDIFLFEDHSEMEILREADIVIDGNELFPVDLWTPESIKAYKLLNQIPESQYFMRTN